jgi:Retroviral aspartyl protease
LEEEDFQD